MPPRPQHHPTQPDWVKCTCQACGPSGELVPRPTRRNHRRDDADAERAKAAQSTITSTASHVTWLRTIKEELNVLAFTPVVHPERHLVFVSNPSPSIAFELEVADELLRPNHAPFALAKHASNSHFLDVETRLTSIYYLLQSLGQADAHDDLIDSIQVLMERLVLEKHIQWNNQCYPNRGQHNVNTEIFFFRGPPRSNAYRCAVLVSLVLKHIYATPLRAIKAHLAGLRSLLRWVNLPLNEINQLPSDPRTITTYYQLHPITRRYICCPKCNCVYLWDGSRISEPECSVPRQCTYHPATQDPICDTDLWRTRRVPGNRIHHIPIKIYTHQPLKYWLGRLLSRPHIEDFIDNARSVTANHNGVLNDIWGSPCLQALETSDKQSFLPGPSTEGRLIFGLAIDSFDPTHVKAASQSISSTGIWLVLLNLPAHLRYLHENMYVAGVIPGPHKPSMEEINHYLDIVIDDLLEFFHPGVYLSKTFKYQLGRLYKAMLVPLVCDMLAARQAIGQAASPSAHSFCTTCDLDQDDIDILDSSQWPSKDLHHVRHYADLWKSAATTDKRKKLFDASGIRWSPLLRLPYWDPAKFTVIDAMHTLDLGLFSNQCRSLFALNADVLISGDGACLVAAAPVNKRIYTKAHISAYRKCQDIVVANRPSMEQELLQLDRKALYTFCMDNIILSGGRNMVVGTRWVLVRSIIDWRNSPIYTHPRLDIPELSNQQHRTQSEEPERESTPDITVDKNFLPTIKLLLCPSPENITKLPETSTKKTYLNICAYLELDPSHIDARKRSAKQDLQDYLLEKAWILLAEDDTLSARLGEMLPKPNNRVVLGKDIMEVVWSDMKKTQTPTWVATAPPNWGTKQRGKLSAAQWRVICTIHLPITLIRLWDGEQGRKPLLLDHFMDLVCAVRLANMKTSSQAQIAAYNRHMFRYVSSICRIYPDQKLKPTHHCALHIGQFLESMGPTHSHNSPFFERYINFFHHQNTNSHPGELETTLLNSSACNANLRGLLADDNEIRPLVCEMLDAMNTIDKEDIRGFRLASILDPNTPTSTSGLKKSPLELTVFRQLLWKQHLNAHDEPENVVTPWVMSFPQIALRGVCYSTSSHIPRNSVIFFSEVIDDPLSPSVVEYQQLKAGFIDIIFQPQGLQSSRNFYLLIRELTPVVQTDGRRDPYTQYGFASGFLCQRDHQTTRVINLDQLKSHAALTPMELDGFGDVYHVLCIDRMMNIFSASDLHAYHDN